MFHSNVKFAGPASGRGVYVDAAISNGFSLISDTPIIFLPVDQDTPHKRFRQRLAEQYVSLTPQARIIYDALPMNENWASEDEKNMVRRDVRPTWYRKATTPPQLNQLHDMVTNTVAIWMTNRMQVGTSRGSAIFPLIARIKPSCTPNVTVIMTQGRAEVRAIVDLAPGTELTMAYSSRLDTQSPFEYRARLKNVLGFDCGCWTCQGPHCAQSEANRKEMRYIAKALRNYVGLGLNTKNLLKKLPIRPPKQGHEAVDLAGRYISLLQREGLVGMYLADGYIMTGKVHEKAGFYMSARDMYSNAAECLMVTQGPFPHVGTVAACPSKILEDEQLDKDYVCEPMTFDAEDEMGAPPMILIPQLIY